MKNRSKSAVIIVVMSFTVLIATAFLLLKVFHMRNSYIREEYRIIAAQVHDITAAAVDNPVVAAQTMAADVFLKEMLLSEEDYSADETVSKMSAYLAGLKDAMGARTAFVISDGSKRYYTHEGLNKVIDPDNDEHDVWYSIFVNSRKSYDLDVDTDQVNNDAWTMFANVRIEDENGRLLGVCGMGFAMDHLQNILKDMEEQYDITVNFVDSDGIVQVDNDIVNIESANLYDVQYGKEKDGYEYKDAGGNYVIMRYVELLNWYLVLRGSGAVVSRREIIQIVLCGLCIIAINIFTVCSVRRSDRRSSENNE